MIFILGLLNLKDYLDLRKRTTMKETIVKNQVQNKSQEVLNQEIKRNLRLQQSERNFIKLYLNF
jgi:hypothetical protein